MLFYRWWSILDHCHSSITEYLHRDSSQSNICYRSTLSRRKYSKDFHPSMEYVQWLGKIERSFFFLSTFAIDCFSRSSESRTDLRSVFTHKSPFHFSSFVLSLASPDSNLSINRRRRTWSAGEFILEFALYFCPLFFLVTKKFHLLTKNDYVLNGNDLYITTSFFNNVNNY